MKRGELIALLIFIVSYVITTLLMYCGIFFIVHGKLPPWSR